MSDAIDLQHIVQFFETLSADSARNLTAIYAPDAYFKDPFNEVHDIATIERIYVHMFNQVDDPRFAITAQVAQHTEAFLIWDFNFRMKRFSPRLQCIRGASHLRFGTDGRIVYHRDYWDAAEELYEKIPLLGGLMRLLKRRARN
jgi:steroid Delta-isomerase